MRQLTEDELLIIQRMAALGFTKQEIAAALNFRREDAATFLAECEIRGSDVAQTLQEGLIAFRAIPEVKLHEAASTGDVMSNRLLREIQTAHYINNALNDIDEDEYPLATHQPH